MFTCQLFNALYRIDAGESKDNLLLRLMSDYPELITVSMKEELNFLFDLMFTDKFIIKTNPELSITNPDYNLVIHKWDWTSQHVDLTLNGVKYIGTFEKYKNLVAVICESETVAIFNSNLIV